MAPLFNRHGRVPAEFGDAALDKALDQGATHPAHRRLNSKFKAHEGGLFRGPGIEAVQLLREDAGHFFQDPLLPVVLVRASQEVLHAPAIFLVLHKMSVPVPSILWCAREPAIHSSSDHRPKSVYVMRIQ